MSEFSGLDIIITVFVLFGMWRGFNAGFVQSIVSLIGWFLALVAGTRLSSVLAPSFVDVVDSPVLQLALAFLTIVLIVIAILHLVAYLLKTILKTLKLSFLDKLAGGVLGAGRNVLMVLVVLSMTAPWLKNTAVWQNSTLAEELLPLAPMAKTLSQKTVGQAWKQIDRKPADSNIQPQSNNQPNNQSETPSDTQ